MATKHEDAIREIQDRMRKKKEVSVGEREYIRVEREKEKDREARTKALGKEIHLQWLKPPVEWENAQVIVTIGKQRRLYTVEPMELVETKSGSEMRLTKKILSIGYEGVAQEWALWKWHCDRGSELEGMADAQGDKYILDCDPPEFVWKAAKAEKVAA